MKKLVLGTAAAAALGLMSFGALASDVSALNVTDGDFWFAFEGGPTTHQWSGTLAMDVDSTGAPGGYTILIDDAFAFNGLFVDIVSVGDGLHGHVDAGVLKVDFSNFGIFWNNGLIPLNGGLVTDGSGLPAPGFDFLFGANTPLGPSTWTMAGSYVSNNVVPIPAAVWMFGSALLGIVGVARRKQALAA